MEIIIHELHGTKIAEIRSDDLVINNVQDALDIMANADALGARKIILYEKNISPEFFQLKTGLAGEVLLKFTNYKVDLAIIGEFSKYKSKSLEAFIYETNKGNQFYFVQNIETAKNRLLKDLDTQ